MTRTLRSIQWASAIVVALALLAALVPDATAQELEPEEGEPDEELLEDDAIRTDPGEVAGYRVDATATPVTVRVFEPTIPLPVEPGQPHFELSAGFAASRLGAGPVSRAVSSIAWPGFGIGDGWGTFMGEFGGDPDSDYPLHASAQFPSGPDQDELMLPNGAGMNASARGLDVHAEVDYVSDVLPDLVSAGTLRSETTSTVEDGLATARAHSVAEELSILGGMVRLDGLSVDLHATSDGVEAHEEGTFAVSGLEVMGTAFVVDADGVRVDEDDEDGGFLDGVLDLPLGLGGDLDLQELIGVRVELVDDGEDDEGDEAGARADHAVEGLRITLDLNPMLDVARDLPIRDVISELPSEIQEQVFLLLGLTTQVEIAIGSAAVVAEATEPLDLGGGEMPEAPEAPETADLGEVPEGGADMDMDSGAPPASSGDLDAPETAGPPETGDEVAGPEVAHQLQPARSVPDLFGGLPAPLVALTAGLVGAAAWGLQRLTGAAMSGALIGGAACPHAGDGVPDLRSWTNGG